MEQVNLTEFSGVVGVILRKAMSWTSFATGLLLGFIILASTFLLTVLNAPNALTVFVQLVIALSLSRFAVNGIFGEWSGTVLSSEGGTWTQVSIVTLRYLALTAIWFVPLFFLGLNSMHSQQAMGMMMASGSGLQPSLGAPPGFGQAGAALMFFLIGSVVTPPLFLIVSVSADGFGDLFSPDHWKRLFAGRSNDLFLVYAVYAGALVMTMVIVLPVVIGLGTLAWQLAVLVGGIGLAFMCGLSVNLLGRLCGFFAFGESGFTTSSDATDNDLEPAIHRSGPASLAPAPASPEAVSAVPLSGDPTVEHPRAGIEAALTGMPPLKDADAIVEEASRLYENDSSEAITYLEETRDSHAPHPQILHALAIMAHKAGMTEEAVCNGKEGLPICLERGHTALAAEIFRSLWSLRDQLSLSREQMLAVASALNKQGEYTYAANTYALILQKDTRETRAVKGILQVADQLTDKGRKPAEALRLYEYLLKHCSDSPLAEYMEQGAETARRKIEQSKAS